MAYLPTRRSMSGIFDGAIPSSSTTSAQLSHIPVPPAPVKTAGPSAASQIFGALLGGFLQPKPTAGMQVYTAPAPAAGGLSTGTAVALGLGAIALVYVATR